MNYWPAETMEPEGARIETVPRPLCHSCGSPGDVAYAGLHDRIFGVEGAWTLLRCSDHTCGLLWLDPMPAVDELSRLYRSYYTHAEREKMFAAVRRSVQKAYWRSRFGYSGSGSPGLLALALMLYPFPGVRRELAQQIFELPAQARGRLLDVGCGSGAAMRRMAELGWQVEGVDFDQNAVQLAVSHGLNVRLGSLTQQSYATGAFDAVVMNHVLEHVPDPRALIEECHRILKPGGRLVCITPNASAWCHALFKQDWRGLEPPRHLHIFTEGSLQRIAGCCYWQTLDIKTTIASSHYMAWASSELKRHGRYDSQRQPGLLGEVAGRAFQMIAAARHKFAPDSGEELVLHAVKQPTAPD